MYPHESRDALWCCWYVYTSYVREQQPSDVVLQGKITWQINECQHPGRSKAGEQRDSCMKERNRQMQMHRVREGHFTPHCTAWPYPVWASVASSDLVLFLLLHHVQVHLINSTQNTVNTAGTKVWPLLQCVCRSSTECPRCFHLNWLALTPMLLMSYWEFCPPRDTRWPYIHISPFSPFLFPMPKSWRWPWKKMASAEQHYFFARPREMLHRSRE